MSLLGRDGSRPFQSAVAQRDIEAEVIHFVGGVASPLLADVCLYYVLDLWADWWRKRHAHGDVIIVRFVDDFIASFEHRGDAEQFLTDLRQRFAKFALELHPGKARLIEFGRHAGRRRKARRLGKPETFDFLVFRISAGRPGTDTSGCGEIRSRGVCGPSSTRSGRNFGGGGICPCRGGADG